VKAARQRHVRGRRKRELDEIQNKQAPPADAYIFPLFPPIKDEGDDHAPENLIATVLDAGVYPLRFSE
jgi:hypothetical protein